MIISIGFIVAALSVSLAYYLAGDIWIRRHSMTYRIGMKEHRLSGAIGEVAMLTGCAIILYLVQRAATPHTAEAIVTDYAEPILWVLPYGVVFLIMAVIASVVAFRHGLMEARNAPEGERPILLRTYLVYGVFSSILFSGGVILVLLLLKDIIFDFRTFETRSGALLATLNDPAAGAEGWGHRLEYFRLDSEILLASVADNLTPILIFVTGIFAINLAIHLTPLRTLYVNSAVMMTHVGTAFALLLVVGVGGWIYTQNYAAFVTEALAALDGIRPQLSDASPQTVERYVDLSLRLREHGTLFGFLSRIVSEWGGIAAVLGVAQWAAEQFARPKGPESVAEQERRKP